mmetsp:Transcript_29976/g.53182  ORF Transcript_29976/g.53182 Transcript_29976/m.53182 type:complete len:83 (-) Transcript_29976:96-344(-)
MVGFRGFSNWKACVSISLMFGIYGVYLVPNRSKENFLKVLEEDKALMSNSKPTLHLLGGGKKLDYDEWMEQQRKKKSASQQS